MKAIFLSFALLFSVFCTTASAQAQRKANKETEQWRYEVQASVGQAPKGTAIMRVWTYSKNPQVAIMQAGKNAVHGIIFTGIATTPRWTLCAPSSTAQRLRAGPRSSSYLRFPKFMACTCPPSIVMNTMRTEPSAQLFL